MNFSQISMLAAERTAANNKDIRYIIANFIQDGFTVERLKIALKRAQEYEVTKNGGSQGNRNVIEAAKLLINETPLALKE